MARTKVAAMEFAELQGDDAVLAAITRLTRKDEWAGGVAGRVDVSAKESHKNKDRGMR
jgi:hypothetical protein